MIHKMHFQTSTRQRVDSGSVPTILVVEQIHRSPEEIQGWEEQADRRTASEIFEFLNWCTNEETRRLLARMLVPSAATNLAVR